MYHTVIGHIQYIALPLKTWLCSWLVISGSYNKTTERQQVNNKSTTSQLNSSSDLTSFLDWSQQGSVEWHVVCVACEGQGQWLGSRV